jgi:hypothetical protein
MAENEDALTATLVRNGHIPDPAAMALSMKATAFDLPVVVALESIRFGVRLGLDCLDQFDRIAVFSRAIDRRSRTDRADNASVTAKPALRAVELTPLAA